MSSFLDDLPGIITGALGGDFRQATLTRYGAPTMGPPWAPGTQTSYSCLAISDAWESFYHQGAIVGGNLSKVLILGTTLATRPQAGDKIVVASDGVPLTVVPQGVSTDPATALWTLKAATLVYPRTIAVTRPAPGNSVGLAPYAGLDVRNESAVIGAITYVGGINTTFVSLTGVPAAIGNDASDRGMGAMLPGSSRRMELRIALRLTDSILGSITEDDVVTDDIGKRYQVSAATWTSLGYQLRCSLLEN